ncbi:hypothetical protein, partial [Elstera litoralis]|uniref:hypothetical protein n=1 Tax=Elstera litoralis TaxID=552518 RepID=UPI001E572A6D
NKNSNLARPYSISIDIKTRIEGVPFEDRAGKNRGRTDFSDAKKIIGHATAIEAIEGKGTDCQGQ